MVSRQGFLACRFHLYAKNPYLFTATKLCKVRSWHFNAARSLG